MLELRPNCGGGFTPRPIRPGVARRDNTSLDYHPASTTRVHTPYNREEIRDFVSAVREIPPHKR